MRLITAHMISVIQHFLVIVLQHLEERENVLLSGIEVMLEVVAALNSGAAGDSVIIVSDEAVSLADESDSISAGHIIACDEVETGAAAHRTYIDNAVLEP